MPETANALLVARAVGRRGVGDEHWLLRDIDLVVRAGSRIAISGATGSGKTLLMRALARLDAIDTGEILWRGEAVHGDAIPPFRRQAIYLQQRAVLIEGNVERNLRLPYTLREHRESVYSPEATVARLKMIGREPDFLERPTGELSGGESQIVALLRAIQLHPTLLMLDEPTASLDEASGRRIEQLINDWYDEAPDQRAFLWVSHNEEQIRRVANEALMMEDGRLMSEDPRHGEPSS